MCTANMNLSTDTVNYVFSSCTRNVINEMATYECGVILFMISLYWGSKLHPANGILDDSQRSSAVWELSCPSWYWETKHNELIRCVCGATLEGAVVCDYAMLATLIFSGFCMSYNEMFNDTVVGRCSFNSIILMLRFSISLLQTILL